MVSRLVRKNEQALRWIRAGAFGAGTAWALAMLSFTPSAAVFGIGIATAILALFSPGLAVLLSLIAIALPIIAADFIIGIVCLVIGFASIQYLSQDKGRVYLLILFAFIGAAHGPVWGAVVIMGYLMGASEGAVLAVVAAVVIELAGLAGGHDAIGVIAAGGSGSSVLDFNAGPENLLSMGWLSEAVSDVDPAATLSSFDGVKNISLLLVQPVIWGVAAVVAALIKRPLSDPKRPYYSLFGVAAGVFAAAAGTAAALSGLGDGSQLGTIAASAVTSLLVAAIVVGAWEWVFPPLATRTAVTGPRTMQAEDADVDELLRLISTAEDELASKHTTESVVMITDMKSFSKMTEEEGSVISAKTIQRHRDLLLPVIDSYQGKGKSTGGDGLVASFSSTSDALHAAVTMQRTLKEYNSTHSSERDIIIRVGIASGEVVLDKGGRPFIGNALNMAARIMDLGDGGQIFAHKDVITSARAGDIVSYAHGSVELKNIGEPVEATEVLWDDGQTPTKPRILA